MLPTPHQWGHEPFSRLQPPAILSKGPTQVVSEFLIHTIHEVIHARVVSLYPVVTCDAATENCMSKALLSAL